MKSCRLLSLILFMAFILAVPAFADNTAPVLSSGLELADCTYSFEPGEDPYNENSVGSMGLSFTVNGPENAKDVLIASWQSEPFTQEDAEWSAEQMAGIWKDGLSWTPDGAPPYQGGSNFPIYADDAGSTLYVLLVAIDENIDMAGYSVIEVKVPADLGAGEAPAQQAAPIVLAAWLLTTENGAASAAAMLQQLVGLFGLNV